MGRLNILFKLDGLLENCKTCERKKKYNNSVGPETVCKGCHIYSEINEIGNQLLSTKKERKAMTKTVVLDQESYKEFKAQGLSDAEISRRYGIKQATLSYYKKKWFNEAVIPEEPVAAETTEVTVQEEKTDEYQEIVAQLKAELAEKDKTIDELKEVSRLQKWKFDELKRLSDERENLNAACEDIENELSALRDELETERSQRTTILVEVQALKDLLRLYL